jgi:energy-coupling factor transporter transmembrane protein EcfT
MKWSSILAFTALIVFIVLSISLFLLKIPNYSTKGIAISVFSFIFSKKYLAQMFVSLSIVSLLLFINLFISQKTKKVSISVYLIVCLIVSGFFLQKSNRKGEFLAESHVRNLNDPGFLTIPDLPFSQDKMHKMSSFASYDDVIKTRNNLIRFIWKQDTLPFDARPDSIEKDIAIPLSGKLDFPAYGDYNFSNLDRVDAVNIHMEYGFKSKAYHFIPEKSNKRLFIYHQGHHPGGFHKAGMKVIARLVKEGYAVLAFSMPATGMNSAPQKVKIGKLVWGNQADIDAVSTHVSYKPLEQPTFTPLKLFVHPVLVGLNYALEKYNYERVSMMGLSGGGWTTTVYAAMDTRIYSSYPVAGTMPLYLLSVYPNQAASLGFEYIHRAFIDVGYLKLYVLGAAGKNRYQRQIFNQFDNCCLKGVAAYSYAPYVSKGVAKLGVGGNYKLAILPGNRHAITDAALAVIMHDEAALN